MKKKLLHFCIIYSLSITICISQNVGINTTGAAPAATNMFEVLSTSTTASSVAVYSSHSGAITGTGYAIRASKTGASTTNIAGEFSASGATNNTAATFTVSGAHTTNTAATFSATGATTNYAILVPANSGNVGIGTSTPDSKAILDISSTTQGVLYPRMTTAQRNAIASPTIGLILYNSTTNCLEIYNGSVWLSSCSGFSNSGGTTCSVIAGTASATTTTGVCGVTTALKLTGFLGSSFQWQRSSNNSLFVDISGATTAYYSSGSINSSISASASEYFRCKVSDGTCDTYSNTLTLTNTCASNSWCQKMDFPGSGTTRYGTFSFAIGSKGYMGAGWNGSTVRSDFWEYEPTLDVWTQMADFGGTARHSASGFAIGTKGYVGGGENASATTYSDFYEWDQSTNTWTAKASMPDTRSEGVGISDGTNGYYATGHDNGVAGGSNVVYKYNVAGNSWSTVTGLPTSSLWGVAFNIGSNIYVATGANMNCCGLSYNANVYQSTDGGSTWNTMTSLPVSRYGAFAFATATKGYIGGGQGASSYTTLYEYDEGSNTWTAKTSCATSFNFAASFCVNNIGYVGIGSVTGSYNSQDVFQYFP